MFAWSNMNSIVQIELPQRVGYSSHALVALYNQYQSVLFPTNAGPLLMGFFGPLIINFPLMVSISLGDKIAWAQESINGH